ncbi:MAG: serine/threonine-protein kinase [Gemmatimonadota bacterium]
MAVSFDRLKAALEDRYDVERELGRGGMATVYLARDLKHHRRVAIKVLLPELGVALGAKRFLREIEICAQLAHPHILPLYDSGEASGYLYYVTPYLEGETLRERLKRERQLPLEDALRITLEVADALAHAHAHDVVHRDIKPANILLSGGHAIVADFGLARAITLAGGERLTQTGFAVGTPEYMSPEQARGEESLDGRSDVFSLGCVLYEMLAGRPPFTGRTPQVIMARRMSEPPSPLGRLREAVPPGVEMAVNKALAKNPVDRFPTMEKFAESLERAVDPLSGSGPSIPVPVSGVSRAVPSFWEELRRREVYNTGFVYAVVAWLLVQIVETTFPYLGLSDQAVTAVIVVAIAGFPIALGLSWAFEITREGIRRTQPVEIAGDASPSGRWWVSKRTLVVLAILLALAAAGWWWLDRLPGPS